MFQFALPPSLVEQAEPPDPLHLACQQAHYPIAFDFPNGRVTYHTPEEAYSDLWARSMLKEALSLGGVVNSDCEGESKSIPTLTFEPPAPVLSYPLTLYIAPWQGTPNLPAERMTKQANGWIEAVFMSPDEVRNELARLAPPDPAPKVGKT